MYYARKLTSYMYRSQPTDRTSVSLYAHGYVRLQNCYKLPHYDIAYYDIDLILLHMAVLYSDSLLQQELTLERLALLSANPTATILVKEHLPLYQIILFGDRGPCEQIAQSLL